MGGVAGQLGVISRLSPEEKEQLALAQTVAEQVWSGSVEVDLILPGCSTRALKLWQGMFFHWCVWAVPCDEASLTSRQYEERNWRMIHVQNTLLVREVLLEVSFLLQRLIAHERNTFMCFLACFPFAGGAFGVRFRGETEVDENGGTRADEISGPGKAVG
jgi:hypothetical protein